MTSNAIAIACDHGGFQLKMLLKEHLRQQGLPVIDLGSDGIEPADYPDYANLMAAAIKEDKAKMGVLICGSGIGMSMAANRHQGIRAALVHDALGARLSRQHNDANVLCLGGRMIGVEVAIDCVNIFLETKFEGGRHARRIEKY